MRMPWKLPIGLLVALLWVGVVSGAGAGEPQQAGSPTVSERIETRIQELHQAGEFNGVVAVADEDGLVYRGAVGLGNAEWETALSMDTRFVMGSLESTFTEALVGQLVGEGAIDSAETLSTYLPDSEFGELRVDALYRGETDVSAAQAQLLLVNLLEAVTRASFESLVRERVVVRQGLEKTEFLHPTTIVPQRSSGYTHLVWGKYEKADRDGDEAVLHTSALDLLRWSDALARGEVLPTALMKRLGRSASWRVESFVDSEGATREVCHARGNSHGFSSLILRDGDRLIVLLSNVEAASLLHVGLSVSVAADGIEPTDPRSRYTADLARILKDGRVSTARQLLDGRTRRDPLTVPGPDDFLRVARAMFRSTRGDQVVSWLRFGVEVYPEDVQLHEALGQAIEKKTGDARQARGSFRRALRLAIAGAPLSEKRLRRNIRRVSPGPGDHDERKERRAVRTEHVLRVLDLSRGQIVADVGCGDGWLSQAVAGAVGETGRVYAVEIEAGRLEKVRDRDIGNVIPVLSDPGDTKLPVGRCDMVVLHDVATHVEAEFRPSFYGSIRRALNSTGVLVVFGHHGKTRAQVEELAEYGFVLENPNRLEEALDLTAVYRQGLRFRQIRDDHREH